MVKLTRANAAKHADAFLDRCPEWPDQCEGRGIVTCGGGIKYGGCVWVLCRLLRHLGCELPIEVWCLNSDEFDPEWIELLRPLGVTCRNAEDVLPEHPHPRLGGWELKPYAIKHSRFREVLFLDADNVPVRDPSDLFDTAEYERSGTLFWPDPKHFHTPPSSPLWSVFGASYRDSPDQESGQLLIDKMRCWRALCLCNWYNEHSDFYYTQVYGDKETFRFAWQRLDQPISWPANYASSRLLFTLEQHDFCGEVLFQHRFYRKWSLYGRNTHIPGFVHEELCLGFLDELRLAWCPQSHLMRRVREDDREFMADLAGKRFLYDRPGQNRWPMRLGPTGQVEEGFGPNEHFWWIEEGSLVLVGADGRRKSRLSCSPDGVWRGRGLTRRRTEVRLSPLTR
ncbi:hypothetical protein [Posidoniimonas corsicana]|nr:hypothetical protein [Posidoniimonas corsicana]